MMNRPFRSVGGMGYAFRDQPFRTLSFSSTASPDAGLLDLFSVKDYSVPAPTPTPTPTPPPVGGTPDPLTGSDVGAVMTTGSTTAIGIDGYDLTTSSKGAAKKSDTLQFASRTQTADFDVKVQVASIVGKKGKAGLMLRASGDPAAANVYLAATRGRRVKMTLTERDSAGGKTRTIKSTLKTKFVGTYPNTWLRLTRQGNTVTAYVSTDGATWQQYASTTFAAADPTVLGVAASGGTKKATATAQFRSFQ